MQISLAGKVVIVTGASRGIGEATALAFAESGADVVLVARKIEALEAVAAKVRKKGMRALVLSAHIGGMEDIEDVVARAVKEPGGVPYVILVTNGFLLTKQKVLAFPFAFLQVELKGLVLVFLFFLFLP